jgi:hypothetical protein
MAKCQEMRDATGGNFRVAGASLQEVLVLLEEWCKASDGHRFHYLAARLIKAPGRREQPRGNRFPLLASGRKEISNREQGFRPQAYRPTSPPLR